MAMWIGFAIVCLFFALYFHLSRIHPDHRHCLVYYCNKLYKCPIYLPIKAEREERGKQIKGNKSNYDYKRPKKKIRKENMMTGKIEKKKRRNMRDLFSIFQKKKNTEDFWYAIKMANDHGYVFSVQR